MFFTGGCQKGSQFEALCVCRKCIFLNFLWFILVHEPTSSMNLCRLFILFIFISNHQCTTTSSELLLLFICDQLDWRLEKSLCENIISSISLSNDRFTGQRIILFHYDVFLVSLFDEMRFSQSQANACHIAVYCCWGRLSTTLPRLT